MGAWLLTAVVNLTILLRVNPAVIEARLSRKPSTERFDRIIVPSLLAGTLTVPVIAGLDAVRYSWSAFPLWTLWLGLALHAVGDAIMVWAMAANPYLEGMVRIQTERGHQVVTTGPYALVRHPMYTGGVLLTASMPLVSSLKVTSKSLPRPAIRNRPSVVIVAVMSAMASMSAVKLVSVVSPAGAIPSKSTLMV